MGFGTHDPHHGMADVSCVSTGLTVNATMRVP
jgi:hypothetical protein